MCVFFSCDACRRRHVERWERLYWGSPVRIQKRRRVPGGGRADTNDAIAAPFNVFFFFFSTVLSRRRKAWIRAWKSLSRATTATRSRWRSSTTGCNWWAAVDYLAVNRCVFARGCDRFLLKRSIFSATGRLPKCWTELLGGREEISVESFPKICCSALTPSTLSRTRAPRNYPTSGRN